MYYRCTFRFDVHIKMHIAGLLFSIITVKLRSQDVTGWRYLIVNFVYIFLSMIDFENLKPWSKEVQHECNNNDDRK